MLIKREDWFESPRYNAISFRNLSENYHHYFKLCKIFNQNSIFKQHNTNNLTILLEL